MPPGRRPRRGRSRPGPGSGPPPPAPTRAGTGGRRPRRGWLALSGRRLLRVLAAGALVVHDRPHLDGAGRGTRDLGRPVDRLVEAVALEEVEAAELLLRLREGTVREHALAVADADGGRGRAGLEALAAEDHAGS